MAISLIQGPSSQEVAVQTSSSSRSPLSEKVNSLNLRERISPYLSLSDTLSLRASIGNQESTPPLYQQLFPLDKEDLEAGFMGDMRRNMRVEINCIIHPSNPITAHQEKIRTEIYKELNSTKKLENPLFKTRIKNLLFEYLFTLEDSKVRSLSYGSLGYFLSREDLSDFWTIKEVLSMEDPLFNLPEGPLLLKNPKLLHIVSKSLYREEKFEEQFKITRLINKEFIESPPQKFYDKLRLICLGEFERVKPLSNQNQTLREFLEEHSTEIPFSLNDVSKQELSSIIELVSQNKVREVIYFIENPHFSNKKKEMVKELFMIAYNAICRLENALEIALTMQGDRSNLYKLNICNALIADGSIKEALEFALTIQGDRSTPYKACLYPQLSSK